MTHKKSNTVGGRRTCSHTHVLCRSSYDAEKVLHAQKYDAKQPRVRPSERPSTLKSVDCAFVDIFKAGLTSTTRSECTDCLSYCIRFDLFVSFSVTKRQAQCPSNSMGFATSTSNCPPRACRLSSLGPKWAQKGPQVIQRGQNPSCSSRKRQNKYYNSKFFFFFFGPLFCLNCKEIRCLWNKYFLRSI